MNEKLKFTVGGVEVFLSREDVEQRLRTVEPENIREVSVEVNGKRYPVKQALADATGLLRGNFTYHCFAGICYRSKANVESLFVSQGCERRSSNHDAGPEPVRACSRYKTYRRNTGWTSRPPTPQPP